MNTAFQSNEMTRYFSEWLEENDRYVAYPYIMQSVFLAFFTMIAVILVRVSPVYLCLMLFLGIVGIATRVIPLIQRKHIYLLDVFCAAAILLLMSILVIFYCTSQRYMAFVFYVIDGFILVVIAIIWECIWIKRLKINDLYYIPKLEKRFILIRNKKYVWIVFLILFVDDGIKIALAVMNMNILLCILSIFFDMATVCVYCTYSLSKQYIVKSCKSE